MLTAIDQIANRNHLQLVKAAIPYTPSKSQQMLSLVVKCMELKNVLSFYQSSQPLVSACSNPDEAPGLLEILTDIRGYCDASEQEFLDQCLQMLSTLELYSALFQNTDGNPAEERSDPAYE